MGLMTFRMANAFKAGRPVAVLAEVQHPDGTGYFWTGIGPLDHDGRTWTGAGKLGSISVVVWTSEIEINDITFSVSGLSAEDASRLSASVRGKYGRCWIACLDEDGRVVPDPFQYGHVQFDTQAWRIGEDGTATITIVGHPAFYQTARAIDEVWSSQDLQRRFPGDTGLDLLAGMQNKEVQWTRT
jgi:hypothetical protein